MTQKEYDREEIKKYETLQNEYKKLLSEYEDLKSDDSSSSVIEAKIKDLAEKQKEIQNLSKTFFR